MRHFVDTPCTIILDLQAILILLLFFSRLELQEERERQKEEQVEALKRSMQSGQVRFA